MKTINWKVSMLCFWAAYTIVFAMCTGHTIFNGIVFDMFSVGYYSQDGQLVRSMQYYHAYAKSAPFWPLYCLIIWPLFSLLYFRRTKTEKNQWKTALFLGLCWSIIMAIFDLIAWVLIRHPYAKTFKDYYIDSQPWITIVYLVIIISPIIGMFFHREDTRCHVS